MASLTTRREEFRDYLASKTQEIEEQRDARHYLHGDQWSEEEIKTLKKRGQAPVTHNLYAQRINGIVGILERLKQDPKAYPRTPKHENGAELATATVRFALDVNQWDTISPLCARDGANSGIGGLEIELIEGDMGDPEIGFAPVDSDVFFYDPRSFREDFSDARFMGVAKWISLDVAKELFPEKADELQGTLEENSEWHTTDRDFKWTNTAEKRLFLVDHWYIENGQWKWCIYTGDTEILSGDSYLIDEKGKTQSKYIMFSANVDHDGDRYGFFRNVKSLQDEVNARRSKSLWLANARRVVMEKGAVQDVEIARREAARPDGVVEVTPGLKFEFEDAKSQADMRAQLDFAIKAEQDLEKFGPNPALVGEDKRASSGRAISLLQQAGMAQIGPYIISYRGWKIRVYRAIWNAIQRYWKAERWIRVTDDEGVAQFIQLNGLDVDEFGRPAMVNAIGSLDVDIILDEGPDTINMQADAFDALSALASAGGQVPPGLLVELAPITSSVKKKYLDQIQQAQEAAQQQPNPEVEKARAQLEFKAAESQQNMQVKSVEAQANLQVKREEAAIELELKQREAELALMVKQREAEIALGMKQSESNMAARAARAKSVEEAGFGAEEDDEDDTPKPTIADMLAQQTEMMASALGAVAQAVAVAAAPKEISVVRDASGAIVGGKSEPVNA